MLFSLKCLVTTKTKLIVIWYITTLVFTKELVIAGDDQCTDFQFKSWGIL